MYELTIVLGIMAALLHGVAYVLYNIQAKKGKSKPNIATWVIWAFLAILNAFFFHKMSGDFVTALQFFMGSVACTVTFFYVLITGKFSWPKSDEWAVLALGLVASLVWWIFKSATGANMVVVIAFLISFFPTFKGVWQDPFKEAPLPWLIWTVAFLITTSNVILRWNEQPLALVIPIVLFMTHGGIAILCTNKRKERFSVTVKKSNNFKYRA